MNDTIMKEILINNIHRIHTTPMGKIRIIRNLELESDDIIHYCKEKILSQESVIYKKGKNYYCEINNIIITINSNSYTIITAHRKK